jgi:hypothetical protein
MTIQTFGEFEAETVTMLSPPFRSRFGAVRWADLDAPGPEHEWLVKNVLTRGAEVSMVAGPSKSGKTFVVLDLAMAIARGIGWFGHRAIRSGVIYQAGEGRRGIKKRLRAYRIANGLTVEDDLPFVLMPAPINLYANDDQTDAFIEECRHWAATFSVPLGLIVIDTFAAATAGADENTSKDVGPVLARCLRIAEALRANVLLVHHMNAEGGKVRGHTSITANLENVILVRMVDDHTDADNRKVREAVIDKQKEGEAGQSFRFVLRPVEIDRDEEGDPVTSCVIQAPAATESERVEKTDAGLRLPRPTEVFLRSIYQAIRDHGEAPDAALNLPTDVKVVHWHKVREVFDGMTPEGEGEPDPEKRDARIRAAIKRHYDTLLAHQVIGRKNPHIWLTGRRVKGFPAPYPNRGGGAAGNLPPVPETPDDYEDPF